MEFLYRFILIASRPSRDRDSEVSRQSRDIKRHVWRLPRDETAVSRTPSLILPIKIYGVYNYRSIIHFNLQVMVTVAVYIFLTGEHHVSPDCQPRNFIRELAGRRRSDCKFVKASNCTTVHNSLPKTASHVRNHYYTDIFVVV